MFVENYSASFPARQSPLGRSDDPLSEIRQQLGLGFIPHDRQDPRIGDQAGVHGLTLQGVS
jgi:hypothetical protein